MPNQTIHYSRPIIPSFFKGVSHDDLKWTINYLMTLLEIPEVKAEESAKDIREENYSPRINKLLSIPKRDITIEELNDDVRLQSILRCQTFLC